MHREVTDTTVVESRSSEVGSSHSDISNASRAKM